jgi:hypothetical protein
MPTEEQIQAWEQAGEPIRQQRRAMREKHGGGGRAADEVRRLREAAAKSAGVCADCFQPLALDASVTLTSRFIVFRRIITPSSVCTSRRATSSCPCRSACRAG